MSCIKHSSSLMLFVPDQTRAAAAATRETFACFPTWTMNSPSQFSSFFFTYYFPFSSCYFLSSSSLSSCVRSLSLSTKYWLETSFFLSFFLLLTFAAVDDDDVLERWKHSAQRCCESTAVWQTATLSDHWMWRHFCNNEYSTLHHQTKSRDLTTWVASCRQ